MRRKVNKFCDGIRKKRDRVELWGFSETDVSQRGETAAEQCVLNRSRCAICRINTRPLLFRLCVRLSPVDSLTSFSRVINHPLQAVSLVILPVCSDSHFSVNYK